MSRSGKHYTKEKLYAKTINTGDEHISLDDFKKVKQANARLKLELEILKKATAIFTKEN